MNLETKEDRLMNVIINIEKKDQEQHFITLFLVSSIPESFEQRALFNFPLISPEILQYVKSYMRSNIRTSLLMYCKMMSSTSTL